MLQAKHVSWSAGHGAQARPIVRGVSLQVQAGEMVGIVGPNGCGKSSLLRLLYRALRPEPGGEVRLLGQDIWQLSARAFAQQVAVVSQQERTDFDCTVQEFVQMGRLPHQSRWRRDSARDRAVVADALASVRASHMAGQCVASLSGGEKQRVVLARALAQQPQLIFLDEPTNHLDIQFQLELMDWLRGSGCTVVVVIHDLNLAAQYCDRLYLMRAGEVIAQGAPQQVLTAEAVQTLFDVQAAIDADPHHGKPRVSYWREASHER